MPMRDLFIIIQKISTNNRFTIKFLIMKNNVGVRYLLRHATNTRKYAKQQKSNVINNKNFRLLN